MLKNQQKYPNYAQKHPIMRKNTPIMRKMSIFCEKCAKTP